MSVVNQRLDNRANVVRDHQKLIQTVYQSMSRLDTDIVILRTVMLSTINNPTNFITVLSELDDIRIAIEDLVHGQLSPIVLPPEILESALIDIHRMLTHQASPYISILLERVAARYYRMHNFVAARQGINLLIAVNFHLSADHLDLMLYQLQSFPVPVPATIMLLMLLRSQICHMESHSSHSKQITSMLSSIPNQNLLTIISTSLTDHLNLYVCFPHITHALVLFFKMTANLSVSCVTFTFDLRASHPTFFFHLHHLYLSPTYLLLISSVIVNAQLHQDAYNVKCQYHATALSTLHLASWQLVFQVAHLVVIISLCTTLLTLLSYNRSLTMPSLAHYWVTLCLTNLYP